ncbi:N-acetyltransferase family protein [Paenibacillus caseinilyticus]|uniref:GCN5 family acetyltransferase n=1 Tax=Paenibacillus mucilaginosus K02 TaxID=997761 RepID=I0BP09_9BACL|nr:GNAT family N-acetyltransferase [Paenibacillus mucilaginosus]AFH64106.1 GCN5 family acetyltransferase [Paenibacillus mucilaginosus K02]
MRIRQAQASDCLEIARVHVASWRTTYRGLLSSGFLNGLSEARRERGWQQALQHPQPHELLLVLEALGGEIVGFVNGGRRREQDEDTEAELYALYLLEDMQGKGYGRALFGALVHHLAGHGYRALEVSVLAGNPAEAVYRHWGGQRTGSQQIRIGDVTREEIRLRWSRLDEFLSDGRPLE